MLGDEIRNHRIQAEKDAAGWTPSEESWPNYLSARQCLALFICAEQLFEFRENISILLDRLEDRGKL
jgi:hypothetical protein